LNGANVPPRVQVRASKSSWSQGMDRLVADDASMLLLCGVELSLAAPIVAETEKGRVGVQAHRATVREAACNLQRAIA
jgi:hypothetical protein